MQVGPLHWRSIYPGGRLGQVLNYVQDWIEKAGRDDLFVLTQERASSLTIRNVIVQHGKGASGGHDHQDVNCRYTRHVACLLGFGVTFFATAIAAISDFDPK